MNQELDVIRGLIAKAEHDNQTFLAKAEEYRRRAEQMTAKSGELTVILRYLRSQEADLMRAAGIIPPTDQSVIADGKESGSALPIRALVRKALSTIPDPFTSADLVRAVQAIAPDAKTSSIAGELSRAKTRGDVRSIAKNLYETVAFPDSSDADAVVGTHLARPADTEDEELPDDFFGSDDGFGDSSPPPAEEIAIEDPFGDDDPFADDQPTSTEQRPRALQATVPPLSGQKPGGDFDPGPDFGKL